MCKDERRKTIPNNPNQLNFFCQRRGEQASTHEVQNMHAYAVRGVIPPRYERKWARHPPTCVHHIICVHGLALTTLRTNGGATLRSSKKTNGTQGGRWGPRRGPPGENNDNNSSHTEECFRARTPSFVHPPSGQVGAKSFQYVCGQPNTTSYSSTGGGTRFLY